MKIKNLKLKINISRGSFLVEVLVAFGLIAILLPILIGGIIASRQGRDLHRNKTQAVFLLKEAEEIVRVIRDYDWTAFANNGAFHPAAASGAWSLISGTETVGEFTRQIVISDVSRDSNGAIVTSGGTVDPSTKQVDITVAWGSPSTSLSKRILLTRHDNMTYTETSEDDFNAGTLTGTAVTNDSGGEVILAGGGSGNWCEPNLTITAYDLPKNGVANAISAIEGQVIAGTGENASGVSLANVAISNTNPPSASADGEVDGYKTNDVFTEENYAYLTTDTNTSEVVIIDLTQKDGSNKHPAIGSFDADGPDNGISIATSGNIGFVTQGTNLYTFDLSSKSGSRPELARIALPGSGTKIAIIGSYAYISISGNAKRMQIVEFSADGRTLTNAGYYSNGSAGNGMSVAANSTGTRAYLATTATGTSEMFVINTESKGPSNPSLSAIGSGYEANGMSPKGIGIATGNRIILVGTGGEEYQVVNIANESSPSRCGGLEIDTGVNGVATVIEADEDAYSYILTGDSSEELKIIEGGPGGGFSDTGAFESAVYTLGREIAFNRIFVNFNQPNQTQVRFQVAVANPADGNCSTATYRYLGPLGTPSDFYTDDGLVPLTDDGQGYVNPGLCFRYMVYLNTNDTSSTPIFYDITVNHSP